MKRIREQLEASAGFKTAGRLNVSATAVPLPSSEEGSRLEDLVQGVADRVTEMGRLALASKPVPASANGDASAVENRTESN